MEIDYNLLINHNIADILLLTATPTETFAVHDKMEALCDEGILTIKSDNNDYYLGSFGGYNVIHCQCGDMGTQDVNASTLTTQRALALWPNVKCVIMVGIAFGMYDDASINPQHYSDILVAEKIVPYEGQRLEPNGDKTYRASMLLSKFFVTFNMDLTFGQSKCINFAVRGLKRKRALLGSNPPAIDPSRYSVTVMGLSFSQSLFCADSAWGVTDIAPWLRKPITES